jgi:hypothetical protein
LTQGDRASQATAIGLTHPEGVGTRQTGLFFPGTLQYKLCKALPFVVLLLALLQFLPSLTGYFLSDDFVLLSWTQTHSFIDVLGFFDPNTFWFYRPLVKTAYWVGQTLFGLHPLPFHLLSVLLHLGNGYLVYKLVARQLSVGWRMGWGLVSAIIFMLTPYHAETVSWVAALGDLIAGFCILSALILFQLYRERNRPLYIVLSIALFSVGLFTRETTIILPILLALDLLLLDPLRASEATVKLRTKLGGAVLVLGGYIAVALLYLGIQFLRQSGVILERGGLAFRPLDMGSILLGMMDYVHGLFPGGGFLVSLPLDVLRWVVWAEIFIFLLAAILLWRNRQFLALFGLTWMLLTPLLFIFFSAPTDRYFYLPSIGYALFVSSVLAWVARLMAERRLRLPFQTGIIKLAITAIIVGLLLSQTISLYVKEDKWRMAGQVSGGVFHDVHQAVYDPHDYGAFYFIDIPPALKGVPLFGNGLQQGVQLVYNNRTLAASSVTCAYLQAQVELPRYSYLFRFKGNGVQQLATKEECH